MPWRHLAPNETRECCSELLKDLQHMRWGPINYSLLKGWGAFVHLGRGHSAVMFASRAKIQKLQFGYSRSGFYLLSTLYTAITHMIIALELQSPTCHVSLEFTRPTAVLVLYLIMCVIAVCANRLETLKQRCPKFMSCYEGEQLFTLLMVSMADVNLPSLAVSAFLSLPASSPTLCVMQHHW